MTLDTNPVTPSVAERDSHVPARKPAKLHSKLSLKTILAILAFLLLAIGGVVSAYLTTTNADLRQQASIGYASCDGVQHLGVTCTALRQVSTCNNGTLQPTKTCAATETCQNGACIVSTAGTGCFLNGETVSETGTGTPVPAGTTKCSADGTLVMVCTGSSFNVSSSCAAGTVCYNGGCISATTPYKFDAQANTFVCVPCDQTRETCAFTSKESCLSRAGVLISAGQTAATPKCTSGNGLFSWNTPASTIPNSINCLWNGAPYAQCRVNYRNYNNGCVATTTYYQVVTNQQSRSCKSCVENQGCTMTEAQCQAELKSTAPQSLNVEWSLKTY